uniref:transcription factor bHLH71-like isoform X2 n=1 Tax=Erigeron canadensis TaxID=72917 RepID=UPI001CB97B65|nr:transcription factor bHLH71-like isoform X2 [Erigeron canadensis]
MGTIETPCSCSELLNFILHDTISETHYEITTLFPPPTIPSYTSPPESDQKLVEKSGKKNIKKNKKKKKRAVCKTKQEAECQRMTHITVERNRRKLMNQHLGVLRSLLPESYIQRGDQASIVGGAIEFVKELEHHLQSLEAQKFLSAQQQEQKPVIHDQNSTFNTNPTKECEIPQLPQYFQKLFSYPQYTWSQSFNNNTSKSKGAMADIEVNLVQTHANLRILSRKRLNHLSKFVGFLQTCYLSVLHLNVTTLDPSVLYSVSLKMEEECWLKSADEIAGVVHHILGLVEEEADLCIDYKNEKWLHVY